MTEQLPIALDSVLDRKKAIAKASLLWYRVFARTFSIILGLSAISWGAVAFPLFWQQSAIEPIAQEIINRDAFKPETLGPLVPVVERIESTKYCWPEALRSAAIIRLRLAEDALAFGNREKINGRLAAVEHSIRLSLACAPSDPFLWMALAWVDDLNKGFQQEQIDYLRLSYKLGPNEGWVAVRRNRLALSMFPRLPSDLASDAIHEFGRMVDSWIYWPSIAILTGPGWPIRKQLLATLKDVGRGQREDFARELYAEGYDVAVPGIVLPHDRPWN